MFDTSEIYSDPIIGRKRKGQTGDPYKQISETLVVNRNYVVLTEVPNRLNKVIVNGSYYEIENGEIKTDNFKVDYTHGVVFFNKELNGKTLTFTYMGEGALFFPDSRIYITHGNFKGSASDKFDDIDRLILEQKNRVDTLIRENPQPSEVVDMRTDRNGKVFPVARDRINSEQEKIENAYVDLNNKKYSSLKSRLDADQKIVDDAFLSSDRKSLFDNLDKRLVHDYTQVDTKIDDAKRELTKNLNDAVDTITTRIRRVINVIDFGAKGDGKTDDTKAFQDALDLAKTNNNIEVIVPHGTYSLTKVLVIRKNTYLKLSEHAVIKRDHDSFFIANGASGDSFTKYNGNSNITIDGGLWDYQGVGQTHLSNAFAFSHGQNLQFRNLTIKDVAGSHAIEINACKNVKITNCNFIGYIDTGGRNFSEAIQIDLAKGSGYFGAFGAYDNTPCEDIIVSNCYFGASGTSGTTSWARGIGSHASTIGRWHRNITITNNIFRNLSMQAVRAFSWNNTIISNNQILDCGAGINVVPPKYSSNPNNTKDVNGVQTNKSQNCSKVIINGNIIKGGGTHSSAIRIQSEKDVWIFDVNITSNTISNLKTKVVGIFCQGVSRYNISNNSLDGVIASGVSLTDTYLTTVNDNVIANGSSNGITALRASVLDITGNNIDGNNKKGLSIKTCTHVTISGNNIKRSSIYGIHIFERTKSFTITGNNIIGANKRYIADGGGQCVRITTKSLQGMVSGNLMTAWTDDYVPENALWITSTVTRIVVTGNNGIGLGARFSGAGDSSNVKDYGNAW